MKKHEQITSYETACEALGLEIHKIENEETLSKETKKAIAINKLLVIGSAINKVTEFTPNAADHDRFKYYPRFKHDGQRFNYFAPGYDVSGADASFGQSFSDSVVAEYVGKTFIDLYNEALSN